MLGRDPPPIHSEKSDVPFCLASYMYFLSTSYENSLQTTFLFQVNTLDIIWWWSKQPAWRWFCKVLHRPDQQVRNYFSCSCNDYWPPPQHLCEVSFSFFLNYDFIGLFSIRFQALLYWFNILRTKKIINKLKLAFYLFNFVQSFKGLYLELISVN